MSLESGLSSRRGFASASLRGERVADILFRRLALVELRPVVLDQRDVADDADRNIRLECKSVSQQVRETASTHVADEVATESNDRPLSLLFSLLCARRCRFEYESFC